MQSNQLCLESFRLHDVILMTFKFSIHIAEQRESCPDAGVEAIRILLVALWIVSRETVMTASENNSLIAASPLNKYLAN